MTFDLNEARALHDRSKSNPKVCGTCVHPTQPNYMHPWPCPTAVALGATGRSEWDGPADLTWIETPTEPQVGVGSLLLTPLTEPKPSHIMSDDGIWVPVTEPETEPTALDRAVADAVAQLRNEAVRRLAVGLDLPAEILVTEPETELTLCGRCEPSDPDRPCVKPFGHPWPHEDRDGSTWPVPYRSTAMCQSPHPSEPVFCELDPDHVERANHFGFGFAWATPSDPK